MKKEEIERIIETMMHQNLVVDNDGLDNSTDYVVGGTNLLKKELVKLFLLHFVSNSIAKKYAEFCVQCDRKGFNLLELGDYIKQYCC